jgi:O-acetyl-ADP-ribose deacetylase (regulator of RNase III)
MNIIVERRIGKRTLRLVRGDITERPVDAIVNAANSHLQHGGGVAGAIIRKGGRSIQEESDRIGFVPVGQADITGAGTLPAKFVIHAVGPRMGEGDEEKKLESAVRSSLDIADVKKLQSIAMPAISSGIFGFPKEKCAKILVNESKKYLQGNPISSIEVIEFCVFDEQTAQFFKKELDLLDI